MNYHQCWPLLFLPFLFSGCYRQDPVVRAAQDLQQAAYEFARQETARTQQFNLLELGMSTQEVLKRVGPPSSRQSLESSAGTSRELWTYNRPMRPPTTLTFVDQRLTEIRIE
jgi:hypothetical protein